MTAMTPERSLQQRRDALVYANAIRVKRAQLKRDVAALRVSVDAVLRADDPGLSTMKVEELLLAVPGLGKAKVMAMFREEGISPTKTIGGITNRQRGALEQHLTGHYERNSLCRARRAAL